MAVLTPDPFSVVPRIYDHYEKVEKEKPIRGHLGASIIGRDCDASAWNSFRWVADNSFDGRVLRLFETGHLEEARLEKSLRDVGITVHTVDKKGDQFSFKDLGGHFAGSMDGCALGIFAAPKTWHVLEFKTHNEKSFASLVNNGVQKSKPDHYIQVQVYMHYTGMSRALYLGVNKNTSEIYEERIRYDASCVLQAIAKAKRVIFSPVPLPKISESRKAFSCMFCNFKENCHGSKLPNINCRTCLHSTPRETGGWFCEKKSIVLDIETQRVGCDKHLWIPALVQMVQVDATDNSVEYKDGNGEIWINQEGKGLVDAT